MSARSFLQAKGAGVQAKGGAVTRLTAPRPGPSAPAFAASAPPVQRSSLLAPGPVGPPRPAMTVQRMKATTPVVKPVVAPVVTPLMALSALSPTKGDKPSNFATWLAMADALVGVGTVIVVCDPPDLLSGTMVTVEVKCVLRRPAGAFLAKSTFVAHYHPFADKAKVGSPWASQMHLKAFRGAQWHEDAPGHIAAALPSFKTIKQWYNALPDEEE